MANTKLVDYYAMRAREYERIYQKPERQQELKKLQTMISGSFRDRDVLEIACGTGYWTQFASRSAKSIVALDYNEAVLDIAREKDYGNCPITFVTADAYDLDEIDGSFSAALVCFWWSHVPKAKLHEFLDALHSRLAKGALVFMLDNLYVQGSSTPICRVDNEGNTYQLRELSDGTTHEVLKNFPVREDFIKCVEPVSKKYKFTEFKYYWLANYTLKGDVEQ